jgi:hypothetical protein
MEDTGETLKVSFFVPPQILLHEQWDDMAHDHALKLAHEQGVIPVGPILIETELVEQTGLQEGVPMSLNGMAAAAAGLGLQVVKVTASMLVGSRLG